MLRNGSSEERARALDGLGPSPDPGLVGDVIALLGDPDVRVRGEAFGALILNRSDIAGQLAGALGSESAYVRGFAALVLANRGDAGAVPEIMGLGSDRSAMVRSCALGALARLGAAGAAGLVARSASDPDPDVRRSALQAALELGVAVPGDVLAGIGDGDPEAARLASLLAGRGAGPGTPA